MNNVSAPGVSLIICCYNSASRIAVTLKHIALQKVPAAIQWEVILVDNNSTDNTQNAAQHEWEQHNVPVSFKIVKESKSGLIYAREKGISEAKYEFLLFCDDDNWLEENYIRHAFEIMNANSNIAILGGRSQGNFESNKPIWFENFEKAYVTGKPLEHSGIANVRSYIAGAGMVVRKPVLDLLYALKFKPLLTGRRGKELLSGEDSEICLLIMFLGYDLYYDDRLQFIHFITANRLSWKYCVSMISSGHAIPQVYFDFYRYCWGKILDHEEPSFENGYAVIKKRSLNRLIKSLSPVRDTMKILFQSGQGSKKEIEIKAAFNKLKFALGNKKRLSAEFKNICLILYNIKEYRLTKSGSNAGPKKVML